MLFIIYVCQLSLQHKFNYCFFRKKSLLWINYNRRWRRRKINHGSERLRSLCYSWCTTLTKKHFHRKKVLLWLKKCLKQKGLVQTLILWSVFCSSKICSQGPFPLKLIKFDDSYIRFRQYDSSGISEITLNVKWHNWQFSYLAGGLFFFSNCSADLIVNVVQAAGQNSLTYSLYLFQRQKTQHKTLSEALF